MVGGNRVGRERAARGRRRHVPRDVAVRRDGSDDRVRIVIHGGEFRRERCGRQARVDDGDVLRRPDGGSKSFARR